MEASMTFDIPGDTDRYKPPSIRQNAPQRAAVLNRLGLTTHPERQFDAFAATLAEKARRLVQAERPPVALVNFVTDVQSFAGRYAAADHPLDAIVEREMPDDYGWCPHVIDRGLALVLDDVCDYPRFVGNVVVDKAGIRSYVGAPLIYDGEPFGTICLIDQDPQQWGKPGLDLIKAEARNLMTDILKRPSVLA
jgi:GAF domain-containing protein